MPEIVVIGRQRDRRAERAPLEEDLAQQLSMRGYDVVFAPEPYDLPEDVSTWEELAGLPEPAAFFTWLHIRAAQCVLRRHGLEAWCTQVISLTQCADVPSALAAFTGACSPARPASPGTVREIAATTAPRWYPVMDTSRCTNCGHCLQFCLFGVYSLDASAKVTVTNPDNCKPGCPACARICPRSAIMFPLYWPDPAIAGAPGEFVALDAAARRMFYVRTNQPCPLCGLEGEVGLQLTPGATPCPECGRDPSQRPAQPAVFSEIDELIGQLEDFARGDAQ